MKSQTVLDAPLPVVELPTGVGPIDRPEAANPYLRVLPSRWEVARSAEFVAAEDDVAALEAEAESLPAEQAKAITARAYARLGELSVRERLLPEIIDAARRQLKQERVRWLEANRALIDPHLAALTQRAEDLLEQRARIDAELDDLNHARNNLSGQQMAYSHELGELNRELLPPVHRERARVWHRSY